MVDFNNSLKRFHSLKTLAEKNNGYIEPTLYVSEIQAIIDALENIIHTDNKDIEKEVFYRSMFQEETWDYLVECPTCGKYVYMRNHCSSCGQKLAYTNVDDLLCKDDDSEWE